MNLVDNPASTYSIRTELILWFVFLSLIPLSVVAWLNYKAASDGLIEAAKAQITQSARLNQDFVTNWFDYRFMDLKNQSKDQYNLQLMKSLQQGLASSKLSLRDYIKSDDWKQRIQSTDNGLVELMKHYDYIHDLYLIGTSGDIIYSVTGEAGLGSNLYRDQLSGSNFARCVRQALQTGESCFSDLERIESSHYAIAGFLVAPILDEQNQAVGVLAIQLHLERIFDLMTSQGTHQVNHYLVGVDDKLRTPVGRDLAEVLSKIVAQSGLNNREIFEYRNPQGKDVIGLSLPLKFAGVDWILVSERERGEVLAATATFAKMVMLVFVLTALVAILLSVYLARRLTRPIQQLVEATQAVSSGRMDQHVDANGHSEFKRLAHSFNQMLDRRRAFEQDLDASHQKINQAMAELADQKYALDQHSIVATCDENGCITYANERFCAVSGYRFDELLGRGFKIFESKRHSEGFYRKLRQTVSDGKVWQGEVCQRGKLHKLYWTDTTIVPFTGQDNKINSFVVISSDITERKRAEEALLKSEQNLIDAQRSAKIGHYSFDVASGQWSCSLGLEEVFGIDQKFSKDLAGWTALLEESCRESVLQYFTEEVLGRHQHFDREYQIVNAKTGQKRWVHGLGELKFDDRNQPVEMFGTIQDITDRKKAEIALQRAEKMESIGQLTGGIAHDFNNILGVIMGNLDLLKEQLQRDPKACRRLTAADKAANRAANLTKQLLGFSRRKATHTKAIDINQLFVELDDVLRHSLGPQIKLTRSLKSDLWLTKIDPGDFQDALLNLLINARDAMPRGGQVILETANSTLDQRSCELNAGAIPGDYVQLSVSDTGEGISKEVQKRVFEPFFTTKGQGKGTGLGLAMVFGFVKRSGGYVKVYSELGVGTTFRLYLPRVTGRAKEVKPEVKNSLSLPTGVETILVVDDEAGLVSLATDSLQQLGYRVQTAVNAQQALTRLAQNPQIDLVFSDIVMPGGMDGYELAQHVKQEYPEVKLLLTSGYTEKAARQNGHAITSLEVLSKPYSQQELAIRIRSVLGDAKVSDIGSTEVFDSTPAIEQARIEWLPAYETGVKAIDFDHQNLVTAFNQCYDLIDQLDESTFFEKLQKLFAQVERHFLREELIMRVCDYPHLKNHKQIHALLIKQLKEKQRSWSSIKLERQAFFSFFAPWLIEHIIGVDMELVPYCQHKDQLIELELVDFEANIDREKSR